MALPVDGTGTPLAVGTVRPSGLGVVRRGQRPINTARRPSLAAPLLPLALDTAYGVPVGVSSRARSSGVSSAKVPALFP